MEIFIMMYIGFCFVALTSKTFRDEKSKRLYQAISCFLILWLIQGLRHETIGIDSFNSYRPYFENLQVSWSNLFDFKDTYSNFEIGYITLNKAFKFFISTDTQWFIFFCSFISIFPIAWVIYKYSPNIIFSYWVFASFQFYHFGFSGLRQAIALAFTCLAFHFIVEKKIIYFVGLVLLASTFHTSAIMFIPAYWLYQKVNMNEKTLIISLVLLIVVVFFIKDIAFSLLVLLFGGEKYSSALMESTVPSYNLLILFILILVATYMSKVETLIKLRSFMLMAVLFQSLGIIAIYATRMAYYYSIFFVLTIPFVVETTTYLSDKKMIRSGICLFLAWFFFYCNASGYLEVIPYKFFWE